MNVYSIDLEQQIQNLYSKLKGKRVGFLTNPTGVDQNLNLLIDEIYKQKDIQLICFFSPEHGLRGDQQAGTYVEDYTDSITGLPVYSLYGTRKMPTDEQLATIDILVYYIQGIFSIFTVNLDVGTRFYTYIWTMSYAMDAVAINNKQFIVFDRPNPLNSQVIEGCPNNIDAGLVGRLFKKKLFGIPQRYGLTIGELAILLNEEYLDNRIQKLKIIKMINYNRNLFFDEIKDLQWIMPSPNMPTLQTAIVYPGNGIFEGTQVSEGRGSTRPFEIIGSNFTDSYKLTQILNDLNLPGVIFRPLYFQPTFNKYQNQICGGFQIHVIDRNIYQSVRTGLYVLKTLYNLYGDQVGIMPGIERLFGISWFDQLIKIQSVDNILSECQHNLNKYKQLRQKYLLYENIDNNLINIEQLLIIHKQNQCI